MDNGTKNYTPLAPKFLHKNQKTNLGSTVLMNVSSVMVAIALVLGIYINKSGSQSQTLSSKADEKMVCTSVVQNPTSVTAHYNEKGVVKEVKADDTLQTNTVTFSWDSINNASSYFAVLAKGTADQTKNTDPITGGGIETKVPTYTFTDIKPGTYTLYVRSRRVEKGLPFDGFSNVDPNNCKAAVFSLPLFSFSVK